MFCLRLFGDQPLRRLNDGYDDCAQDHCLARRPLARRLQRKTRSEAGGAQNREQGSDRATWAQRTTARKAPARKTAAEASASRGDDGAQDDCAQDRAARSRRRGKTAARKPAAKPAMPAVVVGPSRVAPPARSICARRAVSSRRRKPSAGTTGRRADRGGGDAIRLQPAEQPGALAAPDVVAPQSPRRAKASGEGEALGYDYLTVTDHVVLPDMAEPGYPVFRERRVLFDATALYRHEMLTLAA